MPQHGTRRDRGARRATPGPPRHWHQHFRRGARRRAEAAPRIDPHFRLEVRRVPKLVVVTVHIDGGEIAKVATLVCVDQTELDLGALKDATSFVSEEGDRIDPSVVRLHKIDGECIAAHQRDDDDDDCCSPHHTHRGAAAKESYADKCCCELHSPPVAYAIAG